MGNGAIHVEPYGGFESVSASGTQIVWHGTNAGPDDAQPGEIVDVVTLAAGDGTPWLWEMPNAEVVQAGTNYTGVLYVDPLPPPGMYELSVAFNQSDVVEWRTVELTADGFSQQYAH